MWKVGPCETKAMGRKGAACKTSGEWYLALILDDYVFENAGQIVLVLKP